MIENETPRRFVEDDSADHEVRRLLEDAANDRPEGRLLERALDAFLEKRMAGASTTKSVSRALLLLGLGTSVVIGAVVSWYLTAPKRQTETGGTDRRGNDVASFETWNPSVELWVGAVAPLRSADIDELPTVPSRVPGEATGAVPKSHPRAATGNDAPRADSDMLDAELRRLRDARAALNSGNPEGALAELDAYDRAFSAGSLIPEAHAMRVDALLAAGRTEEGMTQARTFLRKHPRSPQAGRIQRVLERGAR